MAKILQFPQAGEQKPTHRFAELSRTTASLLETVRGTSRIRPEDRVRLARNLGDAAYYLLSDHGSEGAKRIFEKAWGENSPQWYKRKRYLHLPDEPDDDPYVPGNYVARGPEWATLIAAAADLTADPQSGRTVGRQIRSLLSGTEFVPAGRSSASWAEEAREMLTQWAAKICERVEKETDLAKLYDVLAASRFDLRHNDVDLPCSLSLSEALNRAADHDAFDLFGTFDPGAAFDLEGGELPGWSYPTVYLGAMCISRELPVFEVPADVQELFRKFLEEISGSQGLGGGSTTEAKITAWLDSIGGHYGSSGYYRLPDVSWEGKHWGFADRIIEVPRPVFLSVRPKGPGVGIWLSLPECHQRRFIPVDYRDMVADVIGLPKFREWFDMPDFDNLWNFGGLWMPSLSVEAETEDELASDAAEQLFGLVQLDDAYACCRDWLDETLEGWLHDDTRDDLMSAVFGGDDSIRFVPAVATNNGHAVPCDPSSLMAAILRNLAADTSHSIADSLLQEARLVADQGLRFHQEVLRRNRELIQGM